MKDFYRTKNIHYLPGRVRINMPGLINKACTAEKLSRGLSSAKGIFSYDINIFTGRVLIYFDEAMYSLENLVNLLERFVSKDSIETQILENSSEICANISNVHYNTEFRDLNLEKLWAHVLIGGAVLSLLFLKKRISGGSWISSSSLVFNFAALTAIVTGYPVLKRGLVRFAEKGSINQELLLGLLGYSSLLLRENVVGLGTIWASNALTLLNNLALARSRKELNKILYGKDIQVKIQKEKGIVLKYLSEVGKEDEILLVNGDKVSIDCIVAHGSGRIVYENTSGEEVTAGTVISEGSLVVEGSFTARPVRAISELAINYDRYSEIIDDNEPIIKKIGFLALGISLATYLFTKDAGRAMAVILASIPSSFKFTTSMALNNAIHNLDANNIRVIDPKALVTIGDVDMVIINKDILEKHSKTDHYNEDTVSLIKTLNSLGIEITPVKSISNSKEKALLVEQKQREGFKVCFIGGDSSDAEAMSQANVGLGVISGWSSIIYKAQLVVRHEQLKSIKNIFITGRKLKRVREHNKVITTGVSILSIPAAAIGRIPLLTAPLIPHLSSAAVILHSALLPIFSVRGDEKGYLLRGGTEAAATIEDKVLHGSIDSSQLSEKLLIDAHCLPSDHVCHILHVNKEWGLSAHEIICRQKIYGTNKIIKQKQNTFLTMFLEQFKDFLIAVSLGAGAISYILGEKIEAITISGIVLIEVLIGAIQEHRAEASLKSLEKLSAPEAIVLRNGQFQRVLSESIVPGDIVLLEAGCVVPADARLLEAVNLEVEESILTGESIPVIKSPELVREEAALADRTNMVYMGTSITKGKAIAIVARIGADTELGKIAQMLNDVNQETPEIQREMMVLGKKITKICIFSVAAIVLIGVLRGIPFLQMLRTGVSLAVGAIPEGLSSIVTIAMAIAVNRMAKKNAIARKLSAIPSLGSLNIICTDKTGTLTVNQMTVKEVYTMNKKWTVSGEGYNPNGKIIKDGKAIYEANDPDILKLIYGAMVCNNARLVKGSCGNWKVIGDPTEGALINLGIKGGFDHKEIIKQFQRCKEVPFDSERKLMSVICKDKEGNGTMYTKGATEILLDKCSFVFEKGSIRPINNEDKLRIVKENKLMATKALRVLALAFRPYILTAADKNIKENDLIFVGLIGMMDPPRSEIKISIEKCNKAGIHVVMITGDNKDTALAVARLIGLNKGKVMQGFELEKITDEELAKNIDDIKIFARTSPNQKLRIIRILKDKGFTVAMTGDGVNDAPAVKEANIGIAMGRNGSDVTKEAAKIVLTDDNFSSIVSAIEEGRGVRNNIKTSIYYILTGNLGEIIAIFLSAVGGTPTPLTPAQILWVNLVTEGFPALAIGARPPGNDTMSSTSLADTSFVTSKLIQKATLRGAVIGLATFGIFMWEYMRGGLLLKARTMAFASLVLTQLFHALEYRKNRENNKSMVSPAVLLSFSLFIVSIYVPFLRGIFGTTPLSFGEWAEVVLLSGAVAKFGSML